MNSQILVGRSQKGGEVILYNSVLHSGHTFTFSIKTRGADGMAVRCQGCLSTNSKYKKEVPYVRIEHDRWTRYPEDPDRPSNEHFCVSGKVVDTTTSRVVARQVYRKATQSCETDTKRPKYVHNNMAASVSAELNELDRGYVDDLHAQVNAKLPRKVNSRRAFAYHNLKSFDVIRNPYESLPLDLQETLSPRPSNTGNPNNGNRWIIYQEREPTEEPMIILGRGGSVFSTLPSTAMKPKYDAIKKNRSLTQRVYYDPLAL
ncbi:hypothetical protein QR680_012860 [Steinernema hermaphroditum]|uniref:Uncharacterized protein n=1 Tax=Steinernema hermaphroditum TaxID=289476 RepID=A0AA39I3I5_9BILA|nr:hypothetical protein QR680_012860 [Steinernema hermaphroditum]